MRRQHKHSSRRKNILYYNVLQQNLLQHHSTAPTQIMDFSFHQEYLFILYTYDNLRCTQSKIRVEIFSIFHTSFDRESSVRKIKKSGRMCLYKVEFRPKWVSAEVIESESTKIIQPIFAKFSYSSSDISRL